MSLSPFPGGHKGVILIYVRSDLCPVTTATTMFSFIYIYHNENCGHKGVTLIYVRPGVVSSTSIAMNTADINQGDPFISGTFMPGMDPKDPPAPTFKTSLTTGSPFSRLIYSMRNEHRSTRHRSQSRAHRGQSPR